MEAHIEDNDRSWPSVAVLVLSCQLLSACGTWAFYGGHSNSMPGALGGGQALRAEDRIGLIPGSREVESFVECVRRDLERHTRTVRVVAPTEVYRLASGGSEAPLDVLRLEPRGRLAANGVRYVAIIDGVDYTSPNEFGTEAPFLWGFAHDRRFSFSASIYGTAAGDLVTTAHVSSQGIGGAMFFWLIIPVPVFAPTESRMCGAMSDALRRTFEGVAVEPQR
jgi:hypothetical protein